MFLLGFIYVHIDIFRSRFFLNLTIHIHSLTGMIEDMLRFEFVKPESTKNSSITEEQVHVSRNLRIGINNTLMLRVTIGITQVYTKESLLLNALNVYQRSEAALRR